MFCNPNNPEDIAAKIYELYNNENLKKDLIKKGIERAKAWQATNFTDGVLKIINDFSRIRRNWK